MDRLTGMAVFVRAADLGSFTAAGRTLGMSPQMVGKHVGALEARLGAPLLRRTTRRQSLTEVGRHFYERCRIILAEAAAADALAHDMNAAPSGRLRVSAPITFGACRLAPLILGFIRDHPGMEIELTLADRYVDIVDEGFDVVVRLGPIESTTLAARELMSHDQVLCASPAYLAAHGTPEVPEDLLAHACLAYLNWSGRPYAEWRFSRDGVAHPVQVRSRFQVNDGRTLLAAALDGHGIVLQPEAVVREALDAGRLLPILTEYEAPSRPMFLLFLAHRPQPPRLRFFIDAVVAAFGQRATRPRPSG